MPPDIEDAPMTRHHGPNALDASIAIESAAEGGENGGEPMSLSAQELVGRAILRLRLYRGWSQRHLERIAHVDQSTLSRLETVWRSNVGARRLGTVLEALRVADVVLLPDEASSPTTLERMLYVDRWDRAGREADRRVERRHESGRRTGVSRRRSA